MAFEHDSGTPSDDQKYIRTFAADMEAAKQGTAADWTPYREHKEEPPAPVAPPSAPAAAQPVTPPALVAEVQPATAPVPAREPQTPPTGWNEEVRQQTLARLHEQMERDKARGIVRTTEHEEPLGLAPREATVSPIHTYSQDFTDRAQAEQASKFSLLAAEQDAGPHTSVSSEAAVNTRRMLYAGVGAVFLLAGGVGLYVAYMHYLATQVTVELPQTITAPIFVDDKLEVTGEGAALIQSLTQSVSKPLAANAVRYLYSTNATTTRTSVFVTTKVSAPSIVMRNIVGQGSMAGVVNATGQPSLFFILAVSSYNDTFAGMLAWEKSMSHDLAAFFPAFPAPVVTPLPPVATTTATSTTKTKSGAKKPLALKATTTPALASTTSPIDLSGFTDAVVADHDVRVYHDAQGRAVFLYGYWDEHTLVIARNSVAFAEIVGRLASAHKGQ